MRINNPEILYRYRPLGNSWANTLTELTGSIWFSKSEGLNDPFDGLGYSLKYDRDIRTDGALFKLRNIWTVACFTTKWNNPTMWAHYSNNYSGLCLGYDKKELDKFVNNVIKNIPYQAYALKGVFLKPMNYVLEIPKTFKTEEEPLTIKTHHWEYEDEWRLGLLDIYNRFNDKDTGTENRIPDALSEIIYTDKLRQNELITIRRIVRESNRNIKFYKITFEKGMRIMKREET